MGSSSTMRERLRRWRAAVADGERANELESISRAGRRPPGLNVEIALQLGAFVSSFAASLDRDEEQAPVTRWRKRRVNP